MQLPIGGAGADQQGLFVPAPDNTAEWYTVFHADAHQILLSVIGQAVMTARHLEPVTPHANAAHPAAMGGQGDGTLLSLGKSGQIAGCGGDNHILFRRRTSDHIPTDGEGHDLWDTGLHGVSAAALTIDTADCVATYHPGNVLAGSSAGFKTVRFTGAHLGDHFDRVFQRRVDALAATATTDDP